MSKSSHWTITGDHHQFGERFYLRERSGTLGLLKKKEAWVGAGWLRVSLHRSFLGAPSLEVWGRIWEKTLHDARLHLSLGMEDSRLTSEAKTG